MPYTVTIERAASKFLRDLTDKRPSVRFRRAIDELAQNPRPPGCVKLQGSDKLYRVRVGDYRIVYRFKTRYSWCWWCKSDTGGKSIVNK